MAAEVKLPLVGNTSRRALMVGGGLAVVVMGIIWYRRKKTAVTPGTPATDPNAVDTSGLDSSGMAGGGGGAGTGGFSLTPTGSGPPFTTNSAWYAYAVQQLSGTIDPAKLSADLGKYLAGKAVTGDEESVIDQAIAAADYPPVHGPNDYPPGIRQSPGGGQTPPPPPPSDGGGTVTFGPNPPQPSTDWTTHTTVHEGERLSQVLNAFGMTQADFEAHNPGITQYYRWYIAGKGYQAGPGNGAVIALNTGHDITVLVKSGGW